MYAAVQPASWLHIPQANPQARLRLFCFPYAGGSIVTYRTWPADLPSDIEVCAVQLPGRDARLKEPAFTQMQDLIVALAQALQPAMDKPFAFFGHSMGALIAYELARHLRRHRLQQPLHLLVSARPAPNITYTSFDEPGVQLHQLPDDLFIDQLIQRYNAIPQVVLNEPEILRLLLPTVRADFTLLETYRYRSEEPLECPISAFGGISDRLIVEQDIRAWSEHTRGSFKQRMFPGDHFYLRNVQSALLQAVTHDLYRTMMTL